MEFDFYIVLSRGVFVEVNDTRITFSLPPFKSIEVILDKNEIQNISIEQLREIATAAFINAVVSNKNIKTLIKNKLKARRENG